LLKSVSDPSQLKDSDRNIIHVLAVVNTPCSDFFLIQLFLNNGPPIKLPIQEFLNAPLSNPQDDFHSSPFHLMLVNEQRERVELVLNLCEMCVDYKYTIEDKPDAEGKTPFILAAKVLNELAAIRLLRDHHANIDHQDKSGKTALHYACIYGLKDLIDCLVRSGANLSLRDDEGNLALSYLDDKTLTRKNIMDALKSIQINPLRAENARWNMIHTMGPSVLPCYRKKNSGTEFTIAGKKTGQKSGVLAKKGKEAEDFIKKLQNFKRLEFLNSISKRRIPSDESSTRGLEFPVLSKEDRQETVKYITELSEVSLIDHIMKERKQLQQNTQLINLSKVSAYVVTTTEKFDPSLSLDNTQFILQATPDLQELKLPKIVKKDVGEMWEMLKFYFPRTLEQKSNISRKRSYKGPEKQFFTLKNLGQFVKEIQATETESKTQHPHQSKQGLGLEAANNA